MPPSKLKLFEAAIAIGDLGKIQKLLVAGLSANQRLAGGRTPLSEAVAGLSWSDRDPIVAALLGSGADPNGRDLDGKTPLMSAAISGCVFLVVRLIAAGATLEDEDREGITALSYAAACGHVWVAALLLRRGAKVDSLSSTGITPLACAAMNAQTRTVRYLVQSGAQLDIRDQNGDTALMLAGRANACDVVRLLAEAGTDLYLRNKAGQSVLIEAIVSRRSAVVSSIRECRGLELAPALSIETQIGTRRACGVCGDPFANEVGAVQAHFRTRHDLDLAHSEVSRLLSEPLRKNRTHTGGGGHTVSGGLPTLGKRK